MPITAGKASEKISELRSKLAVYDTLTELIHANYVGSDSGRAESRIDRPDGHVVTEAHLFSVLEDFESRQGELREELKQWEDLVFEPKTAEVRPLRPAVSEPPPAPKRVERARHGGRRLQPASD